MTLNQFLSSHNIKLERLQKLYLGVNIKRKAKEQKVWVKKVMAEEEGMSFFVLDYPEDWLIINAPDIVIEFMKGLNK